MPYDIVDAYEDIKSLSANVSYISDLLKKEGIIPKKEEGVKKDERKKKKKYEEEEEE